jgi:hypothetical protein
MKAAAAPVGSPWLWTLAYGQHEERTPTHGYEATREAAMASFAKSWRRPRGDLGRSQGAVSEELGRLEGVGEAGRGAVTTTISAAHAVWSVVQSEDGRAWHAQLNWDDGRQDRVLRFDSQQAAEEWLRGEVTGKRASGFPRASTHLPMVFPGAFSGKMKQGKFDLSL